MVKFVQMISTDCIKDYPDKYPCCNVMMCRNLPALFIYNKGEIVKQIMTLKELGGPKVNAEIVSGYFRRRAFWKPIWKRIRVIPFVPT